MIALESAELFRLLKPEDLASISNAAQESTFAVGQEIFREGDPGDGLYVVAHGLVEISGVVNGDQRQVFSQIKPGGVFGEMAVIEQLPRSACATAVAPTTVLFLSRAEMQALINRSPAMASALLQLVSHRLRDFNHHYLREVVQAERLAAVGRFARSIVHDLKNPLNIISLTAEMFGKSDAPPAFRASAQARLLKQVARINDLITDLLQFTNSGQNLSLTPVNYAAFTKQIVDELTPELESRSVTITLGDAPPDITLSFDAKLLRRVFVNLIHNAAEVLPENGTVTLRFRQASGEIITAIEDNGPGIAPEIAERLFQPFATHGKAHGTGLGLSICKKIVEDHGGKISAQNNADGGAAFSFTLPMVKV